MPTDSAPHVVMVVGNHVYTDTRVKKMAVTLAGAGLTVTVVGMAELKHRTETQVGGARIIRVPVPFHIRNAERLSQSQRTPPHLLPRLSKQQYVAELRRVRVQERDLVSRIAFARAERGQGGLAAAVRSPILTMQVLRDQARLKHLQRFKRPHIQRRYERDVSGRYDEPARPTKTRTPWRQHLPEIQDLELAFGPVIDELDPDIVHAHDVFALGVAASAVARRRAGGRPCTLIYDAHEYVAGLAYPTPSLPGVGQPSEVLGAYLDLEREYLARADEIITVSEPLADLLVRDYRLAQRPTVVMNIPLSVTGSDVAAPDVRECAGVPAEDPLLVYVGGMHATRGVETLVEALPLLPANVQVAIGTQSGRIAVLLEHAERLGVRSRVHIVPFVEPDQVSTYLSSATVGVHPLTGTHMNRRVAMPNKFFEYFHAGLPIVVSRDTAMADEVRAHGIGEAFTPSDASDLARAVRQVLGDLESYRSRITGNHELRRRYSWGAQAKRLADVYGRLLPSLPIETQAAQPSIAEVRTPADPATRPDPGRRGLLVGPFNMAGQGWEWTQAIRSFNPKVFTEVVARENAGVLNFDCDRQVTAGMWKSIEWQTNFFRHVLRTHSHVLGESAASIFAGLLGSRLSVTEEVLAAHGIRMAHVFHGSEIRDPSKHVDLVPSSPFGEFEDVRRAHQVKVDATVARMEGCAAPRFVTTVDLLDYLPNATWLPVVPRPVPAVAEAPPALAHDRTPVVLHLPSKRHLKGSQHVERVLAKFADAGYIDYWDPGRVRPQDVPEAMQRADVVIDSLVLGAYGLLACEAMQLGRLVICNVARTVGRLPETPPLLQADPDTLENALTQLLDARSTCAELAQQGPAYVSTYHAPSYIVEILMPFLEGSPVVADTPSVS